MTDNLPRSALLALIFAALLPAAPGLAHTRADLILTNGRIYTVDENRAWAEAIAISGEKILAVGSAEEVGQTAGEDTQIIDLKGAFASPGFNDGHVHMDSTGILITPTTKRPTSIL